MKQMKYIKIILAALVFFGLAFGVSAQVTGTATASVTIAAVEVLTVSTASNPTFSVGAPAVAGELPVITPSGGPTYLQYTVVIDPLVSATKKITAHSSAAMLDGLKLDIWAAAPTGTGGVGTAAAGGLSLDSSYTTPDTSDLITGITSCATGSGITQGPAIYYTLSIDAATFDAMETTAAAADYTITFTLLDG